jgi:type II secretory pathway component GspD/PulD (secretin)/tetratricopeptide (TPR) repeat protein
VARARIEKLAGVALSVALIQGGAGAQTPPAPVAAGTPAAAEVRPSRTHVALQSAIDCYRRGDYELAAGYLQQAKAGEADLSAVERDDLAKWQANTNTALLARRDGGDKLRQAEMALQRGKTQEAQELLKVLAGNQYLTAADKQKLQTLTAQVRPGTPAAAGAGNVQLARAKLQQARVLMQRGNYDAAQALATEADKIGATYAATEDTPRKVLDDISKARGFVVTDGDPKSYVAAARQALDRGDLDMAEHLAKEADKQSSAWSSMRLWGDSPAKVLKDVQAARAKQMTVTTKSEGVSQESPRGFSAIKSMIGMGGTQEPARTVETPAPGKTAEPGRPVQTVQATMPAAGPSVPETTDAHALVKQARDLMNAGKLEEADKLAHKANADKTAKWRLFEDSPDEIISELRKLRVKREQEESVKVLAEARRIFEKANGDPKALEEADRMTWKAEHLHGPYGLLDLGDKPSKLRADIEAVRSKMVKVKVPPPSLDVARREPEKVAPGMVAKSMTDVRKPAAAPVIQTAASKEVPEPPPPPAPPSLTTLGGTAVAQSPSVPPSPPPMPSVPPVPPVISSTTTMVPPPVPVPMPPMMADSGKGAAQKLLVEARQLQKDGRLVEARQKALEAQKLRATYGNEEDRPELVLLAVSAQCEKRIEGLLQQATDTAGATADPARFQKADACLCQARQLAEAFGFDTQPIQAKAAWVANLRGPTVPAPGVAMASDSTPAPVAQTMPTERPGTPRERGEALLNQARVELRKGETTTARRFAEEAFTGPYGVQADAEKMLRTIDVEVFNQRVLAANRAFDAGQAAFQRKEYAQAGSILRALDKQLLQPEKQARLKEIMLTPEMQPTAVAQAAHHAAPGTAVAVATDQPEKPAAEASYADQVRAMQEVKFQQLREESLRVRREAYERFQAGETDKALESLQDFTARLRDAQIEPEKVALLKRPVEAQVQQFKTIKSQKDFETTSKNAHDTATASIQRQLLNEQNKQKQVAELMKQYNAFMKEGKYKEAEMYAMRAKDLDPDNPIPGAAIYVARTQYNQSEATRLKKNHEDHVVRDLDNADDQGPVVNSNDPLHIDKDSYNRSKGRKPTDIISIGTKTDKERQIESRMNSPQTLNFSDTPLRQVLDDLRDWTGINIVPDEPALSEDGISLDRPVSMKLEGVSLKSALNLLLHQVHLTYVVKDEVLQITTESHARGKLVTKSYNVADLVVPIMDSKPGSNDPLRAALAQSPGEQQNSLRTGGAAPWLGQNALQGGTNVSGTSSLSTSPGSMASNQGVTKEGPKQTIEELLIKLITNTIAPQSWSSMGGPGTIEYYPLGMALIINQTPDIQEQIAELLAALRRLQDQEVSVEVRFITIAESFFERIGVDFNINLKTDKFTTKYEPQIVSQQFKPFGFVNDFNPSSTVIGLTPGNTFTQDLDIPIRTSSFAQAIPPFGAFPNIPGGNGGIELGLAFLSDIQVFMFMEAAQGDQRTNVMQAPKLTLFNGQTSTITITDQQFFVTNVSVLQQGGQVVFVPQNALLPIGGITMTLQAVISADRRFVRLNMAPTITNIASAVVQLFPITTFITPVFEGGAVGQPIPFTQFLQQPVFNTITVATSVSVPDGGTVLLGGLKRMSEGRNEFGPPILSKLPYINRLFKNVGYGREAESLLMMVTPRIIINAEEEERQTGVSSFGGAGAVNVNVAGGLQQP